MGHTIGSVTQQWVDNMVIGTTKYVRVSNVYYSGDVIYSYGSHFPMARALRDANGTVTTFLVNGDTFSTSTARHQASLRRDISRSGIDTVIIPFSALDAADIDHATVKILDVLPDRWEEKQHVSDAAPDGAAWHTFPITEYRRKSDEDIAEILARRNANKGSYWKKSGDSEWVESDLARYDTHETVTTGHRRELHTGRATWTPEITVHDMEDGSKLYTWETRRHWLGESLIEARTVARVSVTCQSCRGRKHRKAAPPRPLRPQNFYEFRGMLHAKGITLHERVRTAHDLHEQRRNAAIDAWHEEWDCKRCKGEGSWRKTVKRTAKFLSGFDRNEARQTYFFCELPATAATTVDDALEALKPDTVKIAEQMGRTVRRQGDIFVVALTGVDKRALRKRGAVFERRGQLLGTNHVATETATLPDGTLLARGCMTHDPSGRRPDHARITLAGGWYVVVKNTVPLTAA